MASAAFQPITGTFVDGVSSDIPSQNWSQKEWTRQFAVFKDMGMDTVVIIRTGFREQAMFDSKVIKPVVFDPDDRIAMFLDLAEANGINVYMGQYDSNDYWIKFDIEKEVAVNLELIDELLDRYGDHPAFFGWYLSHEPTLKYNPWELWNPFIEKMKALSPGKPILFSPRYEGCKYEPDMVRPPRAYAKVFDHVMDNTADGIAAAAFMDGHVGYGELSQYMSEMTPVLAKHGIEFWSNLETFERDAAFKFPPIEWLKLRTKLEIAQRYVTKIITFEAPHFMSPLSMWESGRHLYRRYREYLEKRMSGNHVHMGRE